MLLKIFKLFIGAIRLLSAYVKFHLLGVKLGGFSDLRGLEIIGKYNNVSVEKNCVIGNVKIHAHGKVRIGSNVVINDQSVIFTASHNVDDEKWETIIKDVEIDDFSWIASNTIILPGVRMESKSVLGAGSLLSRSTGKGEIWAGNPAHRLSSKRADLKLNHNPLNFIPSYRLLRWFF